MMEAASTVLISRFTYEGFNLAVEERLLLHEADALIGPAEMLSEINRRAHGVARMNIVA